MELIPKTVTIAVPVNIPELRGRHATTAPHGVVTSFRAPHGTMAAVDLAISRLDPAMSRGLFMRLVVHSVAEAINAHYDSLSAQAKDLLNERGTSI